MSSARRKCTRSPTPPAQTRGRPRSASSWYRAAGVAAGFGVHGDQSVHAGVEALERPLPLGDVVVHHAAKRRDPLDDPARVAERGDEEADPLLERDVDPALHPLAVDARRLLDERVHADRLRRQAANEPQAGAELVAVDIGERYRLHDADAAGLRDGGDELRVAARVHRAADE